MITRVSQLHTHMRRETLGAGVGWIPYVSQLHAWLENWGGASRLILRFLIAPWIYSEEYPICHILDGVDLEVHCGLCTRGAKSSFSGRIAVVRPKNGP